MGIFISFEGIDCCGKSTQAKLLQKAMNNTDLFSDPGSTKIGSVLRSILKHGKLPDNTDVSDEITKDVELLMFTLSRSILYNNLIKKSLDSNRNVICDRYIDSTVAYQCYGRGFEMGYVMELHNKFCDNKLPDITFLISISVDEWLRRKSIRMAMEAKDRFEDVAGAKLIETVRHGYEMSAWDDNRIISINGEMSVKDIHMEICKILQDKGLTVTPQQLS